MSETSPFSSEKSCRKFSASASSKITLIEMHGSIRQRDVRQAKNTRAKIWTAAFTLEQVNFSMKSKKNLFPKLFRRDAWFHYTTWQSIQLQVMRIDGAAADFSKVFSSIFLKDYRRTQLHIHYVIYCPLKESRFFQKFFRRLFSHFLLSFIKNYTIHWVLLPTDRWRFDGFFESFFVGFFTKFYKKLYNTEYYYLLIDGASTDFSKVFSSILFSKCFKRIHPIA